MRTRIITSPSFGGDRILAAILFEMTMDRDIEGRPTADYLLERQASRADPQGRQGPGPREDGAAVMKPISGLDDLLARAAAKGIFGTKMRSVIKLPGGGLEAVVDQQFEVGQQILAAGLVPIIEPEIDIHSPPRARPKTSSGPRSSPTSARSAMISR